MKLPKRIAVYRCDKCKEHSCILMATFLIPKPEKCPYSDEKANWKIVGDKE